MQFSWVKTSQLRNMKQCVAPPLGVFGFLLRPCINQMQQMVRHTETSETSAESCLDKHWKIAGTLKKKTTWQVIG
jgi:predicted amino acid racemase